MTPTELKRAVNLIARILLAMEAEEILRVQRLPQGFSVELIKPEPLNHYQHPLHRRPRTKQET